MAEDEEVKEESNKPLFGSFLLPSGTQTARYEGHYILKGKEGEDPDQEDAVKIPVRQGQGVYKLDGNIYEGEWSSDKMNGRGQLSFADTQRWGDNNLPPGLFKFMSGDTYDGDWVDNKFHGQGKYVWKSGAYYIGTWEENKMHGDGTFTDVEGREWKGRFYNGQGPGLYTLESPTLQS